MSISTSAAKPSNSYTMEQFIRLGRGVTVNYSTFSYKELLSNGTEIAVLNVINDYMTELKDLVVNVILTDDQYRKYKYKPRLLCHDVYGNGEVYYIILLLNGIIDEKEFDLKKVKMISKANLENALSYIYNAERKYIDKYNTKYGVI